MIKYVGEDGLGYTEDQVAAIRFDELENGTDKLSKFETIVQAIKKGKSVVVWSKNDGDGNTLDLEAHYAGFLIGLEGYNYMKEECRTGDKAWVATWLDFDMLGEIKEAMEQYGYLVEGNGN